MVSQVWENTEEISKEGQNKETCKSPETEVNCTNAFSEDGKTEEMCKNEDKEEKENQDKT